MTIRELIKELEDLAKRHGDYVPVDTPAGEVRDVRYEGGGDGARVVIRR